MKRRRAASWAACGVGIAIACVACHDDKSATRPEPAAPTPTPTSLVALQAPVAPMVLDRDAAGEMPSHQTVRFRVAQPDGGKVRRAMLPGLAMARLDADGGTTHLDLAPASGGAPSDAGVSGAATMEQTWDARALNGAWMQPVAAGHYRAEILVTTCSPLADGGCKETSARPDLVEFDLPASGDVVVEVR